MNTGLSGESTYDFTSEENSAKWKGLLTAALKKVNELFFHVIFPISAKRISKHLRLVNVKSKNNSICFKQIIIKRLSLYIYD